MPLTSWAWKYLYDRGWSKPATEEGATHPVTPPCPREQPQRSPMAYPCWFGHVSLHSSIWLPKTLVAEGDTRLGGYSCPWVMTSAVPGPALGLVPDFASVLFFRLFAWCLLFNSWLWAMLHSITSWLLTLASIHGYAVDYATTVSALLSPIGAAE